MGEPFEKLPNSGPGWVRCKVCGCESGPANISTLRHYSACEWKAAPRTEEDRNA